MLLVFSILKQPQMDQIMYCQSYAPPLKLVFYFQKCFQKIETAATTAATAVIAVYYIKQPQNGSNHVLPEI